MRPKILNDSDTFPRTKYFWYGDFFNTKYFRYGYFFQYQNFPIPVPRLFPFFLEPNLSDTGSISFFGDQIFPIPLLIPVRHTLTMSWKIKNYRQHAQCKTNHESTLQQNCGMMQNDFIALFIKSNLSATPSLGHSAQWSRCCRRCLFLFLARYSFIFKLILVIRYSYLFPFML